MESFVNLASALFAVLMVTIAERPADEDHPFGHSKAEYFSSGFEGLLIVGAAVASSGAAGASANPQPLEQLGWGVALSVASSVLNGLLAWAARGFARAALDRAGGRRAAPLHRRLHPRPAWWWACCWCR